MIPTSDKIKNKVTISPNIATKENTGTTWYSKADTGIALNSGKTIKVDAGINTLYEIVQKSEAGDVIELSEGGHLFNHKSSSDSSSVDI
ncbi:hypothetical protein M601_000430 [Cellulophaga baltica 4]|nr:hypothetical protein M601_000430 [Cellulophaga baltica 4]